MLNSSSSFVCLSVAEAVPASLWLYLFKTIAQNVTTHSVNFNDLLVTCHKTSQMNDRQTERQMDRPIDRLNRRTERRTKQQLGAERTGHLPGATKRRPLDIHNHEAGYLLPSISLLFPFLHPKDGKSTMRLV